MRVNGNRLVFALMMAMLGTFGWAGGAQDQNKTEIRIEKETLPYPVEYEFSRTVGPGRLVKVRHGVDGEIRRVYRVVFDGDRPQKELVRTERDEPVSALIYMGRRGYTPSRHSFRRGRVLTMSATGYDPSPRTIGPGATGRTATGMKAVYGVVAVDPRVIPLGSLVFVEGYGFAIASDTGGAIKGNKIDLCFDSRSKALAFGRRTVTVHVLRSP